MSSINYVDAKAQLVITQSEDAGFKYSLNNFRKKSSIEAVFIFHRALNMMLQAARDPKATPKLIAKPQAPLITKEMDDDEIKALSEQFRQNQTMYELSERAASLMIPFDDYVHIQEWAIPYQRAIDCLPGLKGFRWQSLTKLVGEQQHKRGLLGGGGGEGKE